MPEKNDSRLTHFDSEGKAHMVDVSEKKSTHRTAEAAGWIEMSPEALSSVQKGEVDKGDVLGVARLAGIQAAKRTSEQIPLCHNITLDGVSVDVSTEEDKNRVEIAAQVDCTGNTGAEMEALHAVSVAALTVYDMCKSLDRCMVVGGVRLLHKSGGKSGTWNRDGDAAQPELKRSPAPPPAGGEPEARQPRAAVITVSDRCWAGEREDASGPQAVEMLRDWGAEVIAREIVPDEQHHIRRILCRLADEMDADVIITSGGTGMSPRDVTPDATAEVIERPVPGIPEAIRAASLQKTDRAMLSRSLAGVRGQTLIVNLPGSPTAVTECLEVLFGPLAHALQLLRGEVVDCGRPTQHH